MERPAATAARCEHCGHANPADQRHCGNCGAALVKECTACGQRNPLGFRFCGNCGGRLAEETSHRADRGPVEERRWATALFADLSGFTSRSETLDPEQVTALVDRCMHRLGEAVERYGGVVSNVAGDGLLAVFGVPKAHEDDAERAVHAALDMQRCAREYSQEFGGLELRVGINTGEMMFAPVGPDSRREATVHGDAVNTAARLESASPTGRVLVGPETFTATRGAFAYEEIAPLRMKGKTAPVPAWIAKHRTGPPARRVTSSVAMVGRDLELDLLERAWRRAVTERSPRLAMIVGPAGIGKTRLVDEFLRRIADEGGPRAVHSGRCLPYGQGITYWPLREILWSAAEIPLDATASDAAGGVERLVARLAESAGTSQTEAERTAFALATTCGVPLPENPLERMPPESVAEEVALAWPRFFGALAAAQPTAIVVEDLHWAEPPMLEMVERILVRSEGQLLLMATARPEIADVRPRWDGTPGMTQIALEPLTAADSRLLLADLLPDAQAELVERAVATAEGNPLFTEEIARHLAEPRSDAAVDIPRTVWSLLATRIDALDDDDKSLLQDAAVVGRAFWPATLQAMQPHGSVKDSLRSLEQQGLITPRPTSSLPGQTELWFRHALIRDVAYGSIPKRRRATAHAAVAMWIDELVGDRRAEFIDVVAYHYEAAAVPGLADIAWPDGSPERDAIRASAVQALLEAGSAAARRFATEQALGFAERALALASGAREHLAALELRARAAHAAVRTDEALAWYLEALDLARELDADATIYRLRAYLALLCARYSGAFTGASWKTTAAAIVTDGLAELGETTPTFEVGALLVGRSRMPRWIGTPADRRQTRRDAERAIEIANEIGSPYLLSHAIEALSQPTVQEGFCEARAIAERLTAVAETLADRIEAQETRVLTALLLTRAPDFAAAQKAAEDAAGEAAELSAHRRLHAAGAQTMSFLPNGELARLRTATGNVPALIREDGGRVCPYGAMALAGHALTSFEAGDADSARAAVAFLDHASLGAEGPTLLFGAAEIVRPIVGIDSAAERLERIPRATDSVPRIYELRAALQVMALRGDPRLAGLVAEARELARATCAQSLASVAEWAEAVQLARSGSGAEALATALRATAQLGACGEHYTAARLLTDLLSLLEPDVASDIATETAERLEQMGARATAAEARRYVRG